MIRLLYILSGFVGIVLIAFSPVYAAGPDCKAPPGFVDGPIVSTPEIAREIFAAIATPLLQQKLELEDVDVRDAIDYWRVSTVTSKPGFHVLGGFEMRIYKCDGRVSHVQVSK